MPYLPADSTERRQQRPSCGSGSHLVPIRLGFQFRSETVSFDFFAVQSLSVSPASVHQVLKVPTNFLLFSLYHLALEKHYVPQTPTLFLSFNS